MVTFRCTGKLLDFLDIVPDENPPQPTGALGNWYATIAHTMDGYLVIFVSERSMVTVAVPLRKVEELEANFRMRVYNLLRLIDVPHEVAVNEIRHLDRIRYGKTQNRKVVGSMCEIVWRYQMYMEDKDSKIMSLGEVEKEVSRMPLKSLGSFPSKVARELLSEGIGRSS